MTTRTAYISAEQADVQREFRDALAGLCPADSVRRAWSRPDETVRSLWPRLAELGLFGALIAEEKGGLGWDEADLVLLMEECGRAAVPGPVLAQLLAAAVLSDTDDTNAAGIVEGRTIATLRTMDDEQVPWGDLSDLVMTQDDSGWSVRPLPAAAQGIQSVDRSLRFVEAGPAGGTRLDSSSDLAQLASLGIAAQLIGLSATMLDLTVSHALTREQFGRPIGSQQAVKHQLADAWGQLEHARPMLHEAARSCASRSDDARRDTAAARVLAQAAADRVGRTALQVHGAVGYSWESDLHLWLKRTWVLRDLWGSEAGARATLERALLD